MTNQAIRVSLGEKQAWVGPFQHANVLENRKREFMLFSPSVRVLVGPETMAGDEPVAGVQEALLTLGISNEDFNAHLAEITRS